MISKLLELAPLLEKNVLMDVLFISVGCMSMTSEEEKSSKDYFCKAEGKVPGVGAPFSIGS